jgi:hypothetical protein
MRRLRSKFRSNFLHVIARTLVLMYPRLTSAAPTNVNADDRALCRPRETSGNALTESGLTGAYPLDRIDHPSIEVVRHGGHHDYRTEDHPRQGWTA